jgi:hypothetical protein
MMPILKLVDNSSRNIYLDAARGLHPDCETVHLFGFNRDVGTSYETIVNDGGGIYTFPASAVQMSLVSTTADTMPVQISGLDASRNRITETITLSGTTPVTTTKSFLRINDARITSGSNTGDITISNAGTTYAFIEAGYGVHQAAVYSVPAGFSLYISQFSVTSGTINSNKYGFVRACVKNSTSEIHFFESTFVSSQLTYDLQVPFKVPAGHDFSIEIKSSSSTNEFTVYVGGILIDD